MSATTTRDAKADAALALLCERWPKCFFMFQGRRLPLKIGIHKDIPDGLIEPKILRLAFRLYVNNPGYLNAMRLGAARVDLNGEVAGTVDENDAKSAQARLNGIRKFKKNRKQPRREKAVQDVVAAPPPAPSPAPPPPTATTLAARQLGFAPRGRAKAPRCRMSDRAARERVFDLTPEMLFRRGDGIEVVRLDVLERMVRSGPITGYAPWAPESKTATRVWAAIGARRAGSVRPQDPHRPPLGTSGSQRAAALTALKRASC